MHHILRIFTLLALLSGLLTNLDAAAQSDDPPTTYTDPQSGVRYSVTRYAPADFPVGLAFSPDGRLFYNEKLTGRVRVILPDGTTQPEPVAEFEVDGLQERGLLGIELDPAFHENETLWVVYTAAGNARDWPANTLARLQLEDNIATQTDIFFSLPITTGFLLHNGGNVRFDADGHLYLSIGDYGEAANAQDLETPQGAIHRFSVDEDSLTLTVPEDNPFPDSSVYAYGFRNPWDFAFDPLSGQIWVTENGPSCDDELNLVLEGFNYGWGEDYECVGKDFIAGVPNYMPPMLSFDPTIGISGITFYESDVIPQWQNDLFFCDWVNGDLQRVVIDETRSRVQQHYALDLGDVTCKIGLTTGPDGALYFGTVGDGEGWIYRLEATS